MFQLLFIWNGSCHAMFTSLWPTRHLYSEFIALEQLRTQRPSVRSPTRTYFQNTSCVAVKMAPLRDRWEPCRCVTPGVTEQWRRYTRYRRVPPTCQRDWWRETDAPEQQLHAHGATTYAAQRDVIRIRCELSLRREEQAWASFAVIKKCITYIFRDVEHEENVFSHALLQVIVENRADVFFRQWNIIQMNKLCSCISILHNIRVVITNHSHVGCEARRSAQAGTLSTWRSVDPRLILYISQR